MKWNSRWNYLSNGVWAGWFKGTVDSTQFRAFSRYNDLRAGFLAWGQQIGQKPYPPIVVWSRVWREFTSAIPPTRGKDSALSLNNLKMHRPPFPTPAVSIKVRKNNRSYQRSIVLMRGLWKEYCQRHTKDVPLGIHSREWILSALHRGLHNWDRHGKEDDVLVFWFGFRMATAYPLSFAPCTRIVMLPVFSESVTNKCRDQIPGLWNEESNHDKV